MPEKILRTAIITAGIGLSLISCRTAEPRQEEPAQLEERVLCTEEPQTKYSTTDQKQYLNELAKKLGLKHITRFFFYADDKESLFEHCRKELGYTEAAIKAYRAKLEAGKYLFMLFLPAKEYRQKDPALCIFPDVGRAIQTEQDLTSLLQDYSEHMAQERENGITLNGAKIPDLQIEEKDPTLYSALLEIRALANQREKIMQGRKVSDAYDRLILAKYTCMSMILRIYSAKGDAYAGQTVQESDKKAGIKTVILHK